MKNRLNRLHHKIDLFAVALFIYSGTVLFCLLITFFISNEWIRGVVVLVAPLFILRPKFVKKINKNLHELLGVPF